MVFMNFIIAVISDAYGGVTQYKTGHDYKQRIMMIYEKELHFTEQDLNNKMYFPAILIVRKKKLNEFNEKDDNIPEAVASIQAFIKQQSINYSDLLN